MQDRPTYSELLDAVRRFIEGDVIPKLEGPKKFHARVAANVLDIVQRELTNEDEQLRRECASLANLLEATEPTPAQRASLRQLVLKRTQQLCERIAAGDADEGDWRRSVLAHVRQTVREKLEVANPKYLAADDRLRKR